MGRLTSTMEHEPLSFPEGWREMLRALLRELGEQVRERSGADWVTVNLAAPWGVETQAVGVVRPASGVGRWRWVAEPDTADDGEVDDGEVDDGAEGEFLYGGFEAEEETSAERPVADGEATRPAGTSRGAGGLIASVTVAEATDKQVAAWVAETGWAVPAFGLLAEGVRDRRSAARMRVLRQRLRLLQYLAENIAEPVALFRWAGERMRDARVVWGNSAFLRVLGDWSVTPERVRASDLLSPSYAKPDADRAPLQRLAAAIAALRPAQEQVLIRTGSGGHRPMDVKLLPIGDAEEDLAGVHYLAMFQEPPHQARRALEAERRAQHLRSLLAESADVLTVIGGDGCILFQSSSVKAILGWEPDEMVGRPVTDFLHPDDTGSALQALQEQVARPSDGITLRYRLRRADGAWCWMESRGSNRLLDPDVGGIVVASREINAQVQAELELRRSEGRLKSVLSALEEGVCLVDEQRQVLMANEAAQEMLGLEVGQLVDVTRWDMRQEDGTAVGGLDGPVSDTLATGTPWRRKTLSVRLQGVGMRWLSVSTQPVALGDAILEPHCVLTFRDITEERERQHQLRRLAYHDELTGLFNRGRLLDALVQAVAAARRRGYHAALLFVDLDRFKRINDSLGHAAGDTVLREVGNRLRTLVRDEDTVARIGGDEFVILLHRIGKPHEATVVAQRAVRAIEPEIVVDGEELSISASVGIAIFPEDGDSPELLLRNADRAMYMAKEAGAGRCIQFSPELNAESTTRLRLESEMRHGLEREEFVLWYQPKVELSTGRCIGLEALIRWEHPTRGRVSPADFIPVAEETGQIIELGSWVLEEACRQLAAWRASGLVTRVSVNVSARQFQQPDFVDRVENALSRHGVPGRLLELELTETAVVRQPDRVRAVFERLRKSGVRLALDDFGTGYSSLSMLTRLPFDVLKIDRSFTSQLTASDSAAARSMVEAIIQIGHSRGMRVIAEGVETEEELRLLRSLGCDEVQGYYFGRPEPSERAVEVLQQRA